jgi:hypothetical protein
MFRRNGRVHDGFERTGPQGGHHDHVDPLPVDKRGMGEAALFLETGRAV